MKRVVLERRPLGFPWQTHDPFLYCVHHLDHYPAGNKALGPAAPLTGRRLGQDFVGIDGWRMYHGHRVPGFPRHPHRGFETVTIVRRGYVDHSDSLGAMARYGDGDVQWMTAGRGIVHAEMFPLTKRHQPNPLELFQIWLNLPAESKLVEPHFKMFWQREIPHWEHRDSEGRKTVVSVVAGTLGDCTPPQPPPDSWAAREDADVAIWSVRLSPGARCTLPAARDAHTARTLYYFAGSGLTIGADPCPEWGALRVESTAPLELRAEGSGCELLLLQGRPIGQPVAYHGPFVMNTRAELEQAYRDYEKTRFGGWPWGADDPTHAANEGRFARHVDGRVERPDP